MIVTIVTTITVASRRRTAHFSTEAGVTPRPASTGGAGGTGERSLVVTAACATASRSSAEAGRRPGRRRCPRSGVACSGKRRRGLGHIAEAGVGVAGLHQAARDVVEEQLHRRDEALQVRLLVDREKQLLLLAPAGGRGRPCPTQSPRPCPRGCIWRWSWRRRSSHQSRRVHELDVLVAEVPLLEQRRQLRGLRGARATSLVLYPAFWKTGLAPSIRGWMLPVPGVAMITGDEVTLVDQTGSDDPVGGRCTGGEVVLADVGHPVVAGLVGVVGHDRYALRQGHC